jgi:hypothetical protein
LSHCDAFFDAQIFLHGLHPNPHQHPAQQHHWAKYLDVIHPHRKEITTDNVKPCIPHVAWKCTKTS